MKATVPKSDIINSLDDVLLIISNEYEIEEINQKGLDLLNLKRENVIGKKCYEIIHQTDRPYDYCPFNKSKTTRQSESTEQFKKTLNRYFSIKCSPVFNENGEIIKHIDILRDVTDFVNRKAENTKVKISLEKAEKITKTGYWEFDLDKNIVHASEGARKIYGVSNKELTVAEVKSIVMGEFRKKMDKALNDLIIKNSTYNLEFKIQRKNDSAIRFIHSVAEYIKEKNIVFGVIRDVTELKEAERYLQEQNEEYAALNEEFITQNEELAKAKDKAEESDRLKSSFLNNISHEFRTPMNGIIGFSELLIKPNKTEEQRIAYAEIINESCERLLDIVTDTVEISQIQSNLVEVKESKSCLKKIMDEVFEKTNPKIAKKGLELVLNINCIDKDLVITTDKNKVFRLIKHLIENAIKFTDKGSVELTCKKNTNEVHFSVTDTGIGISPEMQKLIFEPYRQVETGSTRNFEGNGLGLSLVKSYVEMLGGKVWLSSEVNKGTTVAFTLPINGCTNTDIKNDKSESPVQNWTDKTILIAEDEEINFMFFEELLLETKVEIIFARNGRQAVDLCRNNAKIDLILMDIKMPEMDGYAATKLIKEFRGNIPIIAQTAYASNKDISKIKETGFDDYITKPIKEQNLLNIIENYI